ncbi:signal peptidase II [Microbacterium sp. lyk4-40-TSB-66]|uniref:signal peptidase II n=1 Tax=Microbacterium sp. lyk4-40-TSB-66 TaxID=3040294 RepID=UPI00254C4E37|nr:signal peptidase II [Microbacterium sp. lyk4-40-TSB-66]
MRSRSPLRPAAAGIVIAILAVLVLAADQLAKTVAIDTLPPERVVPVLGDALQFYLVRNPGAAFSLGEGVTWVFTIALAVVAGVIVFLAVRRVRSRLWAVVLGLLLGGVLGNLTDRLVRDPGFPVGHVVDFISTPWMMPAIYNVADIFIVSMMISVAILVLVGLRLDGTRETRASRAEAATADTDGEVEPSPEQGTR